MSKKNKETLYDKYTNYLQKSKLANRMSFGEPILNANNKTKNELRKIKHMSLYRDKRAEYDDVDSSLAPTVARFYANTERSIKNRKDLPKSSYDNIRSHVNKYYNYGGNGDWDGNIHGETKFMKDNPMKKVLSLKDEKGRKN